jgi:hypothetical protein
MKKCLIVLTLAFCANCLAQELSQDDFRSLVPFLQKQDYKGAFQRSEALLRQSASDTSDAQAQIAYVNVYASAGMVTVNEMSYKDFEKNIKKFVGKKMKMPGHPCVPDSVKVAFNSFQFIRDNDKLKGFTMTANQKKTNILLFEYYNFTQAPDPKDFVGKTVRTTGILESYELSDSQSKTWIARLQFADPRVNVFVPK